MQMVTLGDTGRNTAVRHFKIPNLQICDHKEKVRR